MIQANDVSLSFSFNLKLTHIICNRDKQHINIGHPSNTIQIRGYHFKNNSKYDKYLADARYKK